VKRVAVVFSACPVEHEGEGRKTTISNILGQRRRGMRKRVESKEKERSPNDLERLRKREEDHHLFLHTLLKSCRRMLTI